MFHSLMVPSHILPMTDPHSTVWHLGVSESPSLGTNLVSTLRPNNLNQKRLHHISEPAYHTPTLIPNFAFTTTLRLAKPLYFLKASPYI